MTQDDVDRIRRRMAETEPSSEWPLSWADLDALLALADGRLQGATKEVTITAQSGRAAAPSQLVDASRKLYNLLVSSDSAGAILDTSECVAFKAALRQTESEDQETRAKVKTLLDGAGESLRHAGNAVSMGKDLRLVAHWVRTLREAAILADEELAIYGRP